MDHADAPSEQVRDGGPEGGAGDTVVDVPTLIGALGEEQLATWRKLSPAQRDRAVSRIRVMRRWEPPRTITIDAAAREVGVTPKRFYEMAVAWRRTRSLEALGVFAANRARPPRLDPRAVAVLQAHVPAVVAGGAGVSVELLARKLAEVAALEIASTVGFKDRPRIPSRMEVRRIVERERARVAAERRMGNDVAFDHCALTLMRPDGRLHLLCAVLDRATRTVFGSAVGIADDPVAAMRMAMGRSVEAIGAGRFRGDWADRVARIEVVNDAANGLELLFADAAVASPGVSVAIAGRPGRYLREALGDWIGRARLRASGEPRPSDPVYSAEEAEAEVARALARHHDDLGVSVAGGRRSVGMDADDLPPEDLIRLLRLATTA